jgi:hypothetical protein
VAVIAAHAVQLSRAAGWRALLASPAMLVWVGLIGVTAFAPVVGSFLRTDRDGTPRVSGRPATALVAAVVVGVAGLALAWWPWLGVDAPGAALATTGLGLLVGGLATSGGLATRGGASAGGGALATGGAVLFLTGLPWPNATPPVTAAVGLVACAGGWITWRRARASVTEHRAATAAPAARVAAGGSTSAAPGGSAFGQATLATVLALAAAGVSMAYGAVLLYVAMIGHVTAVTVPVAGNPVAAGPTSIERGRALYAVRCAACHAVPADVAVTNDIAFLEVVTNGADGMPAFRYELDLTDRGDLLNYVRDERRRAASR